MYLTNLSDVKATYPVGSKNMTAKCLLNSYPSNHGNIWLRSNCSRNIQITQITAVGSWRSQGTQDIDPSWHKLIQHWVNWSKRVSSKGSTDTFQTHQQGMIPNQWLTSSPQIWDYQLYIVGNKYRIHNTVKINGNPSEMDTCPSSPDHHPLVEAVHLVKRWPDAIAVIWLPRFWIHCRSSSLNPWHHEACLRDGYPNACYSLHITSQGVCSMQKCTHVWAPINRCIDNHLPRANSYWTDAPEVQLNSSSTAPLGQKIHALQSRRSPEPPRSKETLAMLPSMYEHVRELCSQTRIKHTHVELPYLFYDVPLCCHAGWPGLRMFQARSLVQIMCVPIPSWSLPSPACSG